MTLVAAIQMVSSADVVRNLETAARLLREARQRGAVVATLPENFAFMGLAEADKPAVAEDDGTGPIQSAIARLARELGLWIVAGTVPLRVPGEARVAAACLVVDAHGDRAARYENMKITGSYDQAKQVAAEFARQRGLYQDMGARTLTAIEAMKTIAFEIAEQLTQQMGPPPGSTPEKPKWRTPDWYVQAISGGMGPLGVYKGFSELRQLGIIDRIPALAPIQAEGCAPMVVSWKMGLEKAEPVLSPKTRIETLATSDPGRTYTMLRSPVNETRGVFESVSDEDAFRAMHVLAKEKNQGEKEFHQAVREVTETLMPFIQKNPKYKKAKILERIIEPERVIMFRVPWLDDHGEIQINRGFRIQMNSAIGPYTGGIRFHPSVTLSILKFLAFEQVFKNSLTTLPMGGGKGGSDFDPKGKTDNEVMKVLPEFHDRTISSYRS